MIINEILQWIIVLFGVYWAYHVSVSLKHITSILKKMNGK